jgi:aminomethyltransferase
VLKKLIDIDKMQYFGVKKYQLGNIPVLVARCGFSGEIGYELYINPEHAYELWNLLIEIGKEFNVGPYGMHVSAILANEKGYLVGSDFFAGATPIEVGLESTISFNKDKFVGKEELLKRKEKGIKTKLMGFEILSSEIYAAPNDSILKGKDIVGRVTYKGVYGPTIGKNIGRGWVKSEYAQIGEELELEHEGQKLKIKLADHRWYDPENKIIRG